MCPLCRGQSIKAFMIRGYQISDCVDCGHRFLDIEQSPAHVEEHYRDSYFFAGDCGYRDYLNEGELLQAHGRRYGRLLERFATAGTVLDVGAAAGFILRGLEESGWSGVGIEPNVRMATHAREALGLDVRTGTLEQCQIDQQFDLITMIQVVAHFYDITLAFETATKHLKPGGLLLVETWNRASLVARMFGKHWHEYCPPTVVHWFTTDRLRTFLATFGFKEIARGRPAKRLKGAHAKSLLSGSSAQMSGNGLFTRFVQIIPDEMVLPYPSCDLFWGVYRLQ